VRSPRRRLATCWLRCWERAWGREPGAVDGASAYCRVSSRDIADVCGSALWGRESWLTKLELGDQLSNSSMLTDDGITKPVSDAPELAWGSGWLGTAPCGNGVARMTTRGSGCARSKQRGWVFAPVGPLLIGHHHVRMPCAAGCSDSASRKRTLRPTGRSDRRAGHPGAMTGLTLISSPRQYSFTVCASTRASSRRPISSPGTL
jgi:hypothetical protein